MPRSRLMALQLKRETPPGDPVPAYTVMNEGEQIGRVYRTEEKGPWLTQPDVGQYENRESAVHAVATGIKG